MGYVCKCVHKEAIKERSGKMEKLWRRSVVVESEERQYKE